MIGKVIDPRVKHAAVTLLKSQAVKLSPTCLCLDLYRPGFLSVLAKEASFYSGQQSMEKGIIG